MEGEKAPFDEAAALAALEELRLSIERARLRRKEIDAEFDDFVSGFKKPLDRPDAPSAPVLPSAPVPPPAAVDPLLPFLSEIPPAPPAVEPLAPPPISTEPEPTTPAEVPAGLLAHPPPNRPRRIRSAGVLGAAAVSIAVAGLLIRAWRDTPPESAVASPPAPTTRVAAPARTVSPAAAPAQVAAAPAPAGAQPHVTALRRVWVRVIVDGNKVLERELQAGDTVPFRPGGTVVVRTGDAGAVHLSIPGHDGPLGRDGEVVTRTFRPANP